MTETRTDCDVVVIGGGHNGLTCAAYLARAGLSVQVVERRPFVGGAALTQEFHPGFRNSVYSYAVSLLNPKVIAELDLARHGLRILPLAGSGWKRFMPLTSDEYFAMPADPDAAEKVIEAHAKGDGKAFRELNRRLGRAAEVLRDVAMKTPPNFRLDLKSSMRGLSLARSLRGLGREGLVDLYRLMTMSVGDYLDELFEGEAVKGLYGYSATVGNMQSVYAPGSAYVLLHHVFGEVNGVKGAWGQAIGGMGAISEAIGASARASGVQISVGDGVREVITKNGRATGIVLESGKVIRSRIVVSNLNPKLLYGQLIDPAAVSEEFRERMRNWRCKSGVFRMNVALSELPRFTSDAQAQGKDYKAASTLIGRSLGYLERAYRDATELGIAREPIIEMQIPSIQDPSLAPEGSHVASLFCQFFDFDLPDDRSWENEAEGTADMIIDHVTRYAPNFRSSVIGRQIKSPLAIQQDLGMTGGDIFHGALHLDQFFMMRPHPQYADYRNPLAGLYTCGSGTHPGGGVTGAPGRNAAREILSDVGKKLR